MRIGLNLLYLLPGVVGGTETYARRLIEELSLMDSTNEYLIFLNRESKDLPLRIGGNFTRVVCPVYASRRGARYAWEQLFLPAQLHVRKVSLLHSLGYVGPVATPCAHIVTIHDLNFKSAYVSMSQFKRNVLSTFVALVGHRADHILTLSDCSKAQIVNFLGIREDRITTTHLAAELRDVPLSAVRAVRNGEVHRPYIIAFGGSAAHKNIPRLIAAFSAIAGQIPHQLMIIGHVPRDGSIADAINRHHIGNRVITTGYLSAENMVSALASADLLAFPSLYEGFGIPVLDAQAIGLPVVCSSAAALPEVAGAGGLYFDPLSIESISAAILAPIQSASIRDGLIRNGADNVRRFSWSQTAATTLKAYEQAVAR